MSYAHPRVGPCGVHRCRCCRADGTPGRHTGRPGHLHLRDGGAGCAGLRRAVRPVRPGPAPLPSGTTSSTSPPSNPNPASPRMFTWPSAAPSPGSGCAVSWPPPTTRSGPGRCEGQAHDAEHLGYGGRRVLVSRRWSGKTLTGYAPGTSTGAGHVRPESRILPRAHADPRRHWPDQIARRTARHRPTGPASPAAAGPQGKAGSRAHGARQLWHDEDGYSPTRTAARSTRIPATTCGRGTPQRGRCT